MIYELHLEDPLHIIGNKLKFTSAYHPKQMAKLMWSIKTHTTF